VNISSAIVFGNASTPDSLRAQLNELPGVEVHGGSEDGKWVITIEGPDDRQVSDTYQHIERMAGVLSVSMVFQQTESQPDQEA
jgi:nitrate reductase NapD